MHYLEITVDDTTIIIDFGDKAPSRGATIAGLRQSKNAFVHAYDIENGKRWDLDI